MRFLRRIFRRFSWTHSIALGVLALFVILRGLDSAPVEILRLNVFDGYQQLKPRESLENPPIVIVDVDEESLKAHGQWPWPRTLVASLVEVLHHNGVNAIAFDILFAEEDRTSGANIARILPSLGEDTSNALRALQSNDSVLADAFQRGRVVLGQSVIGRSVEGDDSRKSLKANFAYRSAPGVDARDHVKRYPALVRNLPILEEAATGIGVFTIEPSLDGIVRQVPLLLRVGEHVYPALSIELLRVASAQSTFAVLAPQPNGIQSLRVPAGQDPRVVPTEGNGQVWVHFAPHNPDIYVSAADILSGAVGPERLAGRLAFVGTSAIGLRDIKATPVEEAMPGVEVHAQLVETILTNDFLTRPFWAIGAEITALIFVGLLLVGTVPFLGAVWTLLLGTGIVAALLGLSWYLFAEQGFLLDMVYVSIASFVVYVVLTYLNYMREERERRQVRGAFSRYMSPDLVAQLADDPSRLKLGGEMRDMTLLFADIRGFTTISEQFDAQGLTRFINRYLTPMTNVILDRRGTIDKYMGDCIMAFWNAPLRDENHAENGVRSGLAMLAESERMNEALKAEAEASGRKYIPLRIGIGVNTGECCVGNMGSELRFDYSVLGDSVNLASRLEGQSKNYGVDFVIGEDTLAQLDGFACLKLDRIQVKGKTVPVDIYCVLGDETLAQDPKFRELGERHGEMLNAYRAQDWKVMRRKITECRSLDEEGRLSVLYNLYTERLDEYERNPPGADWDGVYVALSK